MKVVQKNKKSKKKIWIIERKYIILQRNYKEGTRVVPSFIQKLF
jgi:hypothetical protein